MLLGIFFLRFKIANVEMSGQTTLEHLLFFMSTQNTLDFKLDSFFSYDIFNTYRCSHLNSFQFFITLLEKG